MDRPSPPNQGEARGLPVPTTEARGLPDPCVKLTVFVDASGRTGRIAYDVVLAAGADDLLLREATVRAAHPQLYGRAGMLPTSTSLEMAGIVEALRAASECADEIASTRDCSITLVVCNDNIIALELCTPNFHTLQSIQDMAADHLAPLAELAWSLAAPWSDDTAMELILRRPPRGRRSRRIRAVDERTRLEGPLTGEIGTTTSQALDEGIRVACEMARAGRHEQLRRP